MRCDIPFPTSIFLLPVRKNKDKEDPANQTQTYLDHQNQHIAQAPRQAGFPGWTQTPIPGVSLSAGGLLALADLTTVAQRTAIKGGSSWLDSLLLVPGLHYQQAADEIARSGGGGWSWGWDYGGGGVATAANTGVVSSAGEGFVGMVNNSPMMMYLNKVVHQARERGGGEGVVFLDVGALGKRKSKKDAGRGKGKRGADEGDGDEGHGLDLGWLSHWLYLMSPILTIAALVMLILVEDCRFSFHPLPYTAITPIKSRKIEMDWQD